jgi:hypothetical protein
MSPVPGSSFWENAKARTAMEKATPITAAIPSEVEIRKPPTIRTNATRAKIATTLGFIDLHDSDFHEYSV